MWLALVAAIAWARPSATGLVAGAVLAGLGEALRLWGAGHLVKTDVLTVTGPYARVRHPLYLGTALVAAGFAVAVGGAASWVLLGLVLPAFLLYYLPYKERIESARLERRHGEAYRAYREAVPAWLPARRAVRAPSARSFSCERVRENDEHATLLAVALGFAVLGLRAALRA